MILSLDSYAYILTHFFGDQVKCLFRCFDEVSFRVLRCKILKVEQGVFLSKVDEVLVYFLFIKDFPFQFVIGNIFYIVRSFYLYLFEICLC
jgi:hypothetical protein